MTRNQHNFDLMECVVEFLFAFHGTSFSVSIDHVYFQLNHYCIFFYLLDFFLVVASFICSFGLSANVHAIASVTGNAKAKSAKKNGVRLQEIIIIIIT